MMQSSNRRSFHLDGIASSLGFDRYYGKEDMPLRHDYPQDVPRFGWDYEGFMFLADQLSSQPAGQPFFAFLFTGTTHEPFADPGAKFHVRPHDPRSENGFLNTLHYSDWALGEFMRQAATEPWFEDTVFVFTADHTLSSDGRDLAADYHIPLVIYAPDGSLPPARHDLVGSQYDLLPTLLDLMDVSTEISTFGDSLLAPRLQRPRYAMITHGSITGLIHADGWSAFTESGSIQHNDGHGSPADEAMLLDLKWRMQAADRALRENRWVDAIP